MQNGGNHMILSYLKKQTFILLLSLFLLESGFGTVTLPNMGVTRHVMLQRFGGKQGLCQRTGLDQNTLLQRLIAGGVPDASIITLGFTATELAAARGAGIAAPVAAPAAPIVNLAAQNRQQGITQFATLAANIQQQINNSGQYNAYIDGTAQQRNQIIQAAQAAILAEQQRQAALIAQQQAAQQEQQRRQQALNTLNPTQQEANRGQLLDLTQTTNQVFDQTIANIQQQRAAQQRQADLLRQQQEAQQRQAALVAQQQAAQQAAQHQEQQRRQQALANLNPTPQEANRGQLLDLTQTTNQAFDQTIADIQQQRAAQQRQADLLRQQQEDQQRQAALVAQQQAAQQAAQHQEQQRRQQALANLNPTPQEANRGQLLDLTQTTNQAFDQTIANIQQQRATQQRQADLLRQQQQQQPQQPQPQQQQNGPRGLVNNGNNCFLNSLTQCIGSIWNELPDNECHCQHALHTGLTNLMNAMQTHQANINPANYIHTNGNQESATQLFNTMLATLRDNDCACVNSIFSVNVPEIANAIDNQGNNPITQAIAQHIGEWQDDDNNGNPVPSVIVASGPGNGAVHPIETLPVDGVLNEQLIMYDIKGIVLWSGALSRDSSGGHYIALVKEGNAWYLCDDYQVTDGEQAWQNLQAQGHHNHYNPQMFFYTRQGEQPVAHNHHPQVANPQQANAQQPVQVQQPAPQQIALPTGQNPLVMYRQNNELILRTFSNANNNHYLDINQCPVAHSHIHLGDEILLFQPCGHIVDTTRTQATTHQNYQTNGNCPVCNIPRTCNIYRLPAQITGAVTYVRTIDVAPAAQQPVQQQVATANRTMATTTPTASIQIALNPLANNFGTLLTRVTQLHPARRNEIMNNLVAQDNMWMAEAYNNALVTGENIDNMIQEYVQNLPTQATATTTPVTTMTTPATQDLSQKLLAMISNLNATDEELKGNPIKPQSLLKIITDLKLNPDIEKKVIEKLTNDDQLIKDINDDANGDTLQDLINDIQRRQASVQSKTTTQLPPNIIQMINNHNLEQGLKDKVIQSIQAIAKYGLDSFDEDDLTDTIQAEQKKLANQSKTKPQTVKQIRTDSLDHYLEDIGLEQQHRQLLVSLENGDADSDNTIQQIETLLQKYYDNIDTSDNSARNTSYQLFKKFCIVANLCDTSLLAIEAKITGFTKAHQVMYEKKADIPQSIKDKIDPITATITLFKTRIQAIRLDIFNKLREVYFYFYSGGALKQLTSIAHQLDAEEKLFTDRRLDSATYQYIEHPFSISDLMTVNVKYHIADQAMIDNVDIGGIKRLLLTKLAKTCTHDKLKSTVGLQRVFTSLLWYTLANSYTPQNPILKIDWNGVSVDFSLPEKFWEDLLVNRSSEDCPQTICTEFWKTTELQACRDSLGQGKTEDTIIKNVATTDVDNQTLSSYLNNGALQFLLMRKYIATLQPKQLMNMFSIITADELITIINKTTPWDSTVKQWLIQYIEENKNNPLILKAICTFATGSSKTDTLAINVFSGVEHKITCENNPNNPLHNGIHYSCNCDSDPKQWKLPEGHTCNKYINFYNYHGMTYEIFKDKFEKAIKDAQ